MIAGCRRMLIVTAVEPERAAILDALGDPDRGQGDPRSSLGDPRSGLGDPRSSLGVTVVASGVGAAAAAATTAWALAVAQAAGQPYDAVISTGIGGGVVDRVRVGGLAIGTAAVAADLGAASPDGFLSLTDLGFGTATLPGDPALRSRLHAALPGAVSGPILTVNTVTGTAEGTALLLARHPDAVAEAMEGFGAATAAARADVAFGEVRAVSNLVGPRDRDAWRIPAALGALTAAFAALVTVGT